MKGMYGKEALGIMRVNIVIIVMARVMEYVAVITVECKDKGKFKGL